MVAGLAVAWLANAHQCAACAVASDASLRDPSAVPSITESATGSDREGAPDGLPVTTTRSSVTGREAPPGAPWESQVREAVTAIAQENRIDLAGRLPAAPAPASQIPQAVARTTGCSCSAVSAAG